MKKLISILLLLAMAVSLLACGASEGGAAQGGAAQSGTGFSLKEGQLAVGYGKVNITPEDSVPLGGFGNTSQRMSTGFRTYLYATCIAITDAEGNTAIIYGMDLVSSNAGVFDTVRNSLSQEYGIPVTNIITSASHMHSGPDMSSNELSIQRYAPILGQYLKDAAKLAMEDRAPADMYITTTMTEGLNFVRRYKLEGDIYVGYQSDVTESGLAVIGYETEADHSLQLVKFDRGADKNPVMIANFQTHPHRDDSGKDTLMNYNLVGVFREEIETKLGYDVLYLTGASGNINPESPIAEHNITKDFFEQGKALAQYAIQADDTYEKVNGGKVQSATGHFEGKINHTEDHMVAIARAAQVVWQQTNSVAEVRKQFLAQGIHSPYHAGAIISKAAMGDSMGFDVWAISIGDVGFAVAPYEMFDTNGTFIKENSPKKMTIVATCANGGNGYFPSEIAWEHGGYEPDTTRYVRGSAENLANIYVDLLTQLN